MNDKLTTPIRQLENFNIVRDESGWWVINAMTGERSVFGTMAKAVGAALACHLLSIDERNHRMVLG